VYDFLLVTNSNLGSISRTIIEIQRLTKKCKFFLPLSFNALVRDDSLRIYGKALRFLKLKSSRQPMVKIWWS